MQNRKPHSQKAPQTGHSIFGTILFSLLAVLAVEFLLLTFAVHVTRLGPQLNQNAEDILAMQVDNRSRYLQSIFHDAQELTSLSDAINGLTQQLLDEGEISLSTLDSSSDAAYPLLEAAAPELISTLRIKSVTGVFLILNTHDLDKRKQDSLMPAIYLRDLDPDAAPSQRNADLTFVRAPAQLVQSLSIATDNSWSPTIRYRALGNRGFLYPPFQAAYKDGASLAASDYGHWTSRSYPMPGDTHEAIAYSQPLILPDGTVYGVIGMELLALGTWMYMKSTLGSGPRDALMVVLARKTHRTVGLCRAAVEVVIVFIGWRLGGQVGIGTIVAAVGVGSLFNLNFALLRFNPALLHQENLPETLQRFRERKTIA